MLADLGQRRDEPERADRERPLDAGEPVLGAVGAVAQDEAHLGELVGDRQHRLADPLVVGGEEADERDQQGRGVELVGPVMLPEDAPVADPVGEDVLADPLGLGAPAGGPLALAARLRQAGAAIDGDPAHQLRGDVVLRFVARLPDPLVRPLPDLDRRLDLLGGDLPEPLADAAERSRVDVDRVQQGAVDVVLMLRVGRVPDPYRLRADVAVEMVEGALGQLLLAADPVHDLQVRVIDADALDEAHEVGCLVVEPEHVQAPEREGGVADPGVAVVPVALAAGRLRQRRGQRRDHAAGRRVHQALQGQGRALQLTAPAMVRELAPLEPAPPRLSGLVDVTGGHAGMSRQAGVVGPGQRAERVLVGAEPADSPELPVAELELHVRLQPQRDPVDLGDGHPELPVEIPLDGAAPVVGTGVADELDLGIPLRAVRPADQHPLRLQAAAAAVARLGVDQQGVADDQPARLGRPCRLDHVRARLVAASDRYPLVRGEAQRPGRAVEQRPEDARRVEAGEAEPFDRPIGAEQRAGLAIGDEPVGADPREVLRAGSRRGLVGGAHWAATLNGLGDARRARSPRAVSAPRTCRGAPPGAR